MPQQSSALTVSRRRQTYFPNPLAHMEDEHRIKKGGKWLWERIGSRPQHLFDCEAMQVTAATMLKIIGRETASPDPVDTPDGEP